MEDASYSCPVCGRLLPLTGLERHVNSHLDEDESARDHALALELASTSHPSTIQDVESRKSSTIACSNCEELISLEEWESHSLMHEILEEESKAYRQDEVDCSEYAEERNPPKKSRTGECASTPISGSNLGVSDIQALTLSQRRGSYRCVETGIMTLIRDCLYSERLGSSCTVISAHIDHFESRTCEDVGWGCGWRNIQMLSSHVLTYQWAREALFGGAGFVPDIPSLQQWLELAWASGFDEPGAEFYHFHIHGSKEWIGTTECATLFRSFGLRARIVDFSSAAGQLRKNGQATIDRWFQHRVSKPDNVHRKMFDELPVNTEVHHNVECDVCGAYPIRGICFKSKKKENYDLCSACILNDESPDDYEKVVSSKGRHAKQDVAIDEDVNHESLVKWVWNYFTDGIKDATSKARLNLFQGHVATSDCTPLYFQHQGHSRTIVGVQRRRKNAASKEEVFLLVLDPSNKTEELVHSLRSQKNWQKMIKRGVHTLKKRSYQVCYVEPGIAKGKELEQLKILRSEQLATI